MTESSTSAPIDIGAKLRQARLKHGQSLDVVHQHTRIPKKFLEAMENNRFDEFPALVYLRGFLKSYCEHLDVEFEPLWSQIAPRKPQADGSEAPAPKPEPRAEQRHAQAAPKAREDETPRGKTAPEPSQTALLPIVLGVLLIAGTAIMWATRKSKTAAPPPPPPAPPPAAIAPIHPKEKMSLKVKFAKETWVRLHCDGVLRFEGRAPAGFAQDWTAMNDFTIRVKNPEDVSLAIDGREVKLTPAMQDAAGDYKIGRQ